MNAIRMHERGVNICGMDRVLGVRSEWVHDQREFQMGFPSFK